MNFYEKNKEKFTDDLKSLGKKLIEGLMNFLGVEVTDIKITTGGDFPLL